ncbi:MAG: tetratricopeptide repeat protein [Prevotella sp.]|nr:tetratricopeptide repeat protein [Prevotella sp.]MDD5895978.1 tetratricopeptide repeat protein [Prevotellaceae bacterium]
MANIKDQKSVVEETLSTQEAFFAKNKKAIIYGVLAVVVIIAGIIVYNTYVSAPREDKASTILAKGQQLFGEEQFEKALNGDKAGFPGLLSVASEYGSTDAGNLANLYAGLCYANLGKWNEAAQYIEKFDSKGDFMISPAAEGALGNAYAHLNQLDKAVKHLTNAADKADNNSLSPTFLVQAGEILESQGKAEEALKLYQKVKTKYFNSMQYQSIDKYIERVTK